LHALWRLTVWTILLSLPAVASYSTAFCHAQDAPDQKSTTTIQGRVVDSNGKLVANAKVQLKADHSAAQQETTTNQTGLFTFSNLQSGSYVLRANKSGLSSKASFLSLSPSDKPSTIDLVLGTPASAQSMPFSDSPTFTVAGVTDWTAVGGHGSDATLRTSESLARETITLRPPDSKDTGTSRSAQNQSAVHRLNAELDEKKGDPLAAVKQDEEAVRLDPSEENYFAWGSELLIHRAIWQAVEVFRNGAKEHPQSARMLTGLGAALFAGDLYDESASTLCAATDLDPKDPQPYIFLGKVAIAAPLPLACVEPKLERFAKLNPEDANATYLYAMSVLKRYQQSGEQASLLKSTALFEKAIAIDSKCADASLQLGIISFDKRDYTKAISYFAQAITSDPQLSEAHYRLGVAYDRTGAHDRAQEEFHIHDGLEKQQAELVEQQRREVKQFLIVLENKPASPARQ
jgi:tetratricopeptide (TPR) repeat protein